MDLITTVGACIVGKLSLCTIYDNMGLKKVSNGLIAYNHRFDCLTGDARTLAVFCLTL